MSGAGDGERAALVARLRLARTPHVGPRSYRDLIARFGSAQSALAALPRLSRRGGRERVPPPDAEITTEIAAIARLGGRFLFADDPDGSPLLAEIHDPPVALATRGDLSLLQRPAIAIVGSRNASAAGRRLTERFAGELGEAGFVIVSGLARGIDGAAHRGSLQRGTIAVVAGGVDHVYPPEHADLQEEIARHGLLLSDQPMGLVPRAGHFPRRNRIVAGIAQATLVIEATENSGALITARLAAENGRDVFAVPGSPLEPRSRGCNRLIRDGAMLVETTQDILDGLAMATRAIPRSMPAAVPELPFEEEVETIEEAPEEGHERLVAALGPVPVEVDELVRRCQVTAAEAQMMLLELELAGRIERHPGNRISLVSA
mgnify:FL=1